MLTSADAELAAAGHSRRDEVRAVRLDLGLVQEIVAAALPPARAVSSLATSSEKR